MKCIIQGKKVKFLARAVHALARIGNDLYIDPQPDGLGFRTVDSSRSALVSFLFKLDFFEVFVEKMDDDLAKINDSNPELSSQNPSKCRIPMKSILMVFRSISVLDRTVESCIIHVQPNDEKVKIELNCRYSVQKVYIIPFIECETLKAEYDSTPGANTFTCQSKVMTEAALNFLKNQEEVTIIATPQSFVMKNFLEPGEPSKGAVHTELTMHPNEFEAFCVQENTTVTFCLKELRSFLAFADAFAFPLTAAYGEDGSPIIFSLNNENMLEGSLVMATLATPPESLRQNAGETSMSQTSNSTFRDTEDLVNPRRSFTPQEPRVSTMEIDAPLPHFSESFDEPQLEATQVTDPPPSKKARYLFKRCFEATFNPSKIPGYDRVLAPDSDEEEEDGF